MLFPEFRRIFLLAPEFFFLFCRRFLSEDQWPSAASCGSFILVLFHLNEILIFHLWRHFIIVITFFFLNLYFQNLCSFAISYQFSFFSFFLFFFYPLPYEFYFVKQNKKISSTLVIRCCVCLPAGGADARLSFSWRV